MKKCKMPYIRIVDEVKEVVTLEADQIEKVTYDSSDGVTNFISGVGKRGNELISLLDLNTITLEENTL